MSSKAYILRTDRKTKPDMYCAHRPRRPLAPCSFDKIRGIDGRYTITRGLSYICRPMEKANLRHAMP
jgi:hypothetical protein